MSVRVTDVDGKQWEVPDCRHVGQFPMQAMISRIGSQEFVEVFDEWESKVLLPVRRIAYVEAQ